MLFAGYCSYDVATVAFCVAVTAAMAMVGRPSSSSSLSLVPQEKKEETTAFGTVPPNQSRLMSEGKESGPNEAARRTNATRTSPAPAFPTTSVLYSSKTRVQHDNNQSE